MASASSIIKVTTVSCRPAGPGRRRPSTRSPLPELLPGTLSSWIKQGAPHLTVNADRRGGVLGFNRTFFEPGLAESLVADQRAVARLLAADPAAPPAEAHRLLAQRRDAAAASAG